MDDRAAERPAARRGREHQAGPPLAAGRASAARRCRRRRRLDALVGEGEEQADDERVGEQRRTAVADERQGDPGQRQDLEVAGRDDERLDADDQREPDREERPEVVGGRRADPQAALDDDEVQARGSRRRRRARAPRRAPPAGSRCGPRGSAAGRRSSAGPAPRPDAEQAAAGERVERLDDLVARPRAGRRTGRARCRSASGRASNSVGHQRAAERGTGRGR